MKNIGIIILMVLLGACRNGAEKATEDKIDFKNLHIDISNAKTFRFSDFLDDPIFIPLETKSSSLFSMCEQLVLTDSLFFIVPSNPEHTVLIFNSDGSFRNSIYNRGRGPGEYTSLYNIYVDELSKTIRAFDRGNKCFYSMDYSGRIVEMIKVDGYFGSGLYYDRSTNKYLLDVSAGITFDNSNPPVLKPYHIVIYDQDSKTNNFLLPFSLRNSFASPYGFTNDGKNILYKPPIVDTVYIVKNDKLYPKYRFDFGEFSKPDRILQTKDEAEFFSIIQESRFMLSNWVFMENDRIAYSLHESTRGEYYINIYDKYQDLCGTFGSVLNDYVGQEKEKTIKPSEVPMGIFNNMLVFLHEPRYLLQHANYNKDVGNRLVELLSEITEIDNPILAFYPIKTK